jgi:hypothetical protein
MRTTSLKTIYLAEKELKQAIANWIELEHKDTALADHLMNNACEMEWTQDGGEFLVSMDGEIMDNTMTKDKPSEQNIDQKKWVVKIEHLDATDPDRGVGELCIRFPDELVKQLGWEIGDEIEWEETEICEDWGEYKGLMLGNKSKLFRDADEGSREAASIGME